MDEPIQTPITQPVAEPVKPSNQEPTPQIVPPVEPQPVPQPAGQGEPITVEALSKVDKAVLLKLPVVQSLLENARQQEKDKLYKTIETKDEAIKLLKETVSNQETKLKEKETSTMEDEQKLLAQMKVLQESHDTLMKELADEKEAKRQAELASYKASKIADAQGAIVEGMVHGNTEEEINASVELAKAEYAKIISPLQQKVEELGKPNPANAPQPTNPASTPTTLEFTAEQLRNMPRDEYAKYREQILNSVKNG